MPLVTIARALAALEQHISNHPGSALHANLPARATWDAAEVGYPALAVRLAAPNAAGPSWVQLMCSDMGPEFGSGHAGPSPAWLFRASVAACAVSCIVLHAARSGVTLTRVVCEVDSQSDLRGLLGMLDEGCEPVSAGPRNLRLRVRARAPHSTDAELRALVRAALRCSPVQRAVEETTACLLQVEGLDS
jgi:uncharacterized OsmC-like protein